MTVSSATSPASSRVWFNQPYLAQSSARPAGVLGKVVKGPQPLTMQNPEFEIVEDDEEASLTWWIVPSTASPRAHPAADAHALPGRGAPRRQA
jgi:hypothetical protein